MEKGFDPSERFTEKDVILITYGDLLKGPERSPLRNLAKFCDTYLEGTINTLHILPFSPYPSDRGFSVVDFETVDPTSPISTTEGRMSATLEALALRSSISARSLGRTDGSVGSSSIRV